MLNLQLAFFANDWIAIFAMLLVGAGILRSQPRNPAALVFALLQLNSAGFVLFSRAIMSGWMPAALRITLDDSVLLFLQVMMNTTPGLFMYLCFRLFREGERLPRVLIALFVVQVALEDLVPYLLGVTTHPSRAVTMTDTNAGLYLVFEALPASLEALFTAIALYWAIKDWRADLVQVRRQLRALVVTVACIFQVSFTLITRLLVANDDIRLLYIHESFLAFGTLLNAAVIVVLLDPQRWLATPPARALTAEANVPPVAAPPSDHDYAAFTQAMDGGAYHEAGLTVESLARRLHMPQYRLRKLINERLGYRNFNAMLHAFRVASACAALRDPAKRHLPVLTIALSVGYQSINPFNRAFREHSGVTPSAFRTSQMQ